eukprot:1670859-Prorocentrum_lima.AAC.1
MSRNDSGTSSESVMKSGKSNLANGRPLQEGTGVLAITGFRKGVNAITYLVQAGPTSPANACPT